MDQLPVRGMGVTDHFAAEPDDSAVVERHLLDATPDAAAGFEDEDVGAATDEIARGGQACQPGPEHDEVVRH